MPRATVLSVGRCPSTPVYSPDHCKTLALHRAGFRVPIAWNIFVNAVVTRSVPFVCMCMCVFLCVCVCLCACV